MFNDFLYIFHRLNNGLWYTVFDGVSWSADRQVSKFNISVSPLTIVFNNKLYVFRHLSLKPPVLNDYD